MERINFDIVIVGAGISGLSAAIRLRQQRPELSVCIVEKGKSVGSHIISGALIDMSGLRELLPNYENMNLPIGAPITEDKFYLLLGKNTYLPAPPVPGMNEDTRLISLGKLCERLAEIASEMGAEIFPGFAAASLVREDDRIIGVGTKDAEIIANKITILAEGSRGYLASQLIKEPIQTYGIGIKELWQVAPEKHKPGRVVHTLLYPFDYRTYGGGFIYHMENGLVSLGLAMGLDYHNPYIDPFILLAKFKEHKLVRNLITGGKCVGYGARSISEGGFQSVPKLHHNGCFITGDAAGFMNVPRVKGIHNAIRSGIIAADNLDTPNNYDQAVGSSKIMSELHKVRNIRPAFHYGSLFGLAYSGLDTYILRGKAPFTFKYRTEDRAATRPTKGYKETPLKLREKEAALITANLKHREDQPCHLKMSDPLETNARFASLEQRYCPAAVYVLEDGKIKINPSNCVHCKTCDIKDPGKNITWTPPEGGSGPNYNLM